MWNGTFYFKYVATEPTLKHLWSSPKRSADQIKLQWLVNYSNSQLKWEKDICCRYINLSFSISMFKFLKGFPISFCHLRSLTKCLKRFGLLVIEWRQFENVCIVNWWYDSIDHFVYSLKFIGISSKMTIPLLTLST